MATRADVARLAGVSEAAVSYAITGKGKISTQTRQRILSAMAELDYRPNAMATALAGGKSRIIALLFLIHERGISNADLEYVIAAADGCRELGYNLLLWPIGQDEVAEVRSLSRAGLIDGVLLMEVELNDRRVALLKEMGVEHALIGRSTDADDDLFADRDFAAATERAVGHLADLGHRKLAYVGLEQEHTASPRGATYRAEVGYKEACERRGLDIVTLPVAESIASGRELYETSLADNPDITGLVTLNIEATMGLLAAAQADGARVPRELSVVSIGVSNDLALATTPELTTISPPSDAIGRTAARLLIDRLSGLGLGPERRLWTGELVVRGTSAPPPTGGGAR